MPSSPFLVTKPASPTSPSSVLTRLLLRLHADGLVALGSWLLVLGLALLLGGSLRFTARTLWAPVLAAALGMLCTALCRRPFYRGLGEWWPLIAMIALYMQLDPYTRLWSAQPQDARLVALDVQFLGCVPSEWLARYRRPWLTEVMALAYSSYFLLALGAAAPTYIPTLGHGQQAQLRHRQDFRAVLTAHVLALGIGFLGYLLLPARGPRYFLPTAEPLVGTFGYYEWAVAQWNAMQEVACDAFPSLHTAAAVLAIVHSLRYRRLWPPLSFLPWLIVPMAVLLVVSTIYLRMHYAVDVVAGLLVALMALLLGRRSVVAIERQRGR